MGLRRRTYAFIGGGFVIALVVAAVVVTRHDAPKSTVSADQQDTVDPSGSELSLPSSSGGSVSVSSSATVSQPTPSSTTAVSRSPSASVSDWTPGVRANGILVPERGVYWGIYSRRYGGGSPAVTARTWESQLGRKFDVVLMYYDFYGARNNKMFPDAAMRDLGSERILIIDWESKSFDKNTYLKWSDIAAGKYDDVEIIPQAKKVKEYGKPMMLGFDHEMDLSFKRDGHGSPADYVAAFKHIRRVFAAQGVTNVVWTWVPTGYIGNNQYGNNASLMKQFYPGNEWVDWVGYDPYNFNYCTGAGWKNFEQTIAPFYRWAQANGMGDKPLLLQEYGTVYSSGNPAQSTDWYRKIPTTLTKYPKIKALVRWDSDTNCKVRIDTGPGMVEAFKAAGLGVGRP